MRSSQTWVYAAPFNGGFSRMEPHGGYLCRLEDFDSDVLVRLGRQALTLDDTRETDCSLVLTVVPHRKLLRLAFDGPFTYGRSGAHWYGTHHAMARLVSRELGVTVHAYVLDPEEFEQVTSYGNGRKVGGEKVRYEDVDGGDLATEETFELIQQRWPIGHLAHVFGQSRKELVRLPRAQSILLDLDGKSPRVTFSSFGVEQPRAVG